MLLVFFCVCDTVMLIWFSWEVPISTSYTSIVSSDSTPTRDRPMRDATTCDSTRSIPLQEYQELPVLFAIIHFDRKRQHSSLNSTLMDDSTSIRLGNQRHRSMTIIICYYLQNTNQDDINSCCLTPWCEDLSVYLHEHDVIRRRNHSFPNKRETHPRHILYFQGITWARILHFLN